MRIFVWMKNRLALLLFLAWNTTLLLAQTERLAKGAITDSLSVDSSPSESYALYLPTDFSMDKPWPIVFVFDLEGKGKMVLRLFQQAAQNHGYVLAASNSLRDTLSLSENILVANRMFNAVYALLPIQKGRIYTGGIYEGARFASFVPLFIKGVEGVVSWGGPIGNAEILSSKSPFVFVGIVDQENYNYPEMLNSEKLLNKLKFPNELLVAVDSSAIWEGAYIDKALSILTLTAMAKGTIAKDEWFINRTYEQRLAEINLAVGQVRLVDAYDQIQETLDIFRPLRDTDSLKGVQNSVRKEKLYKAQKRNEDNVFFIEALKKEDFAFALQEDVLTYNYNNLGWWKFQMEELKAKYEKSANVLEQRMGKRLEGFINALVEDAIDGQLLEKRVNEEALMLLWMLKTVIAPKEYVYYKKIISKTTKINDFGTALFYVEELLKAGYTNKEELYRLEDTAILRITPEFNNIVAKYLQEARYEFKEE